MRYNDAPHYGLICRLQTINGGDLNGVDTVYLAPLKKTKKSVPLAGSVTPLPISLSSDLKSWPNRELEGPEIKHNK